MAYSTSTYKIEGTNQYKESIGEYTYQGKEYIIVEEDYNSFSVYLLNDDEELSLIEDEEEQEEVLNQWKDNTYGMSAIWQEEYSDNTSRIDEGLNLDDYSDL